MRLGSGSAQSGPGILPVTHMQFTRAPGKMIHYLRLTVAAHFLYLHFRHLGVEQGKKEDLSDGRKKDQ